MTHSSCFPAMRCGSLQRGWCETKRSAFRLPQNQAENMCAYLWDSSPLTRRHFCIDPKSRRRECTRAYIQMKTWMTPSHDDMWRSAREYYWAHECKWFCFSQAFHLDGQRLPVVQPVICFILSCRCLFSVYRVTNSFGCSTSAGWIMMIQRATCFQFSPSWPKFL